MAAQHLPRDLVRSSSGQQTRAVEPEEFRMAGAKNVSCDGAEEESEPEIWASIQAIPANNTMFFLLFGPNCSGAGA